MTSPISLTELQRMADLADVVYTFDEVRALQLATWKAAMEYAAQICDRTRSVSAVSYETGAACASAIRAAAQIGQALSREKGK